MSRVFSAQAVLFEANPSHSYMIFPDPNNRGNGRLTKAERDQLAPTLQEHGHNPAKELSANAVMHALLSNAAQEHDAANPGSNQVQAAEQFRQNNP